MLLRRGRFDLAPNFCKEIPEKNPEFSETEFFNSLSLQSIMSFSSLRP